MEMMASFAASMIEFLRASDRASSCACCAASARVCSMKPSLRFIMASPSTAMVRWKKRRLACNAAIIRDGSEVYACTMGGRRRLSIAPVSLCQVARLAPFGACRADAARSSAS